MSDEIKILSTAKDFDPPQEPKEPEPEMKSPPDFDTFRWLMSQ